MGRLRRGKLAHRQNAVKARNHALLALKKKVFVLFVRIIILYSEYHSSFFISLSLCFQKEKQSKAPKKGSPKAISQHRHRSLPFQNFKRIKSNLHLVRPATPKDGNQDCTCSEQDPCSHGVCFLSSFNSVIDYFILLELFELDNLCGMQFWLLSSWKSMPKPALSSTRLGQGCSCRNATLRLGASSNGASKIGMSCSYNHSIITFLSVNVDYSAHCLNS